MTGVQTCALPIWLAATFPNLYGSEAGDHNLAGRTNAEVAGFYRDLFRAWGPKLDAQVLATALAVYVTNSTLAGDAAAAYGFEVSDYGVGVSTMNLGWFGVALGLAPGACSTVIDILLLTDDRSVGGTIFGDDWLARYHGHWVFQQINNPGWWSVQPAGQW